MWEESKMDKAQIIEAIKGMTVLELNELVKACEEEFGVSAAAAVVAAAPGAGEAAAAEEQTTVKRVQTLRGLRARFSGEEFACQ